MATFNEDKQKESRPCEKRGGEKKRRRKQGRTEDALAPRGEEGRDKLRKALGRCK